MQIVDLSQTIATGMEIYPGDPEVVVDQVQTLEADGWALRELKMGTHTGTHVDAFSHVTPGQPSIEDISLNRFFGPARRVTSSNGLPTHIGLILDFVPTIEDIERIVESRPPFIASSRLDIKIERPLLDAGIVTYEGLVNIDQLPVDRSFQFYGFPLKISEGDGSPVRAVAIID